jgi:hypothetical protein
MTLFTASVGLSLTQAELDFVDIDVSADTPLYICPYAIQIRHDKWSDDCGSHITSFFLEVLDALRSGNIGRATHLLSHLNEPNETCLGVSSMEPKGAGLGNKKAGLLADALVKSQAFKTGLLRDISEAELFIYGVGNDMISDFTTNVLRGPLSRYTREQCELHNISLNRVTNLGPTWNAERRDWEATSVDLPVINGKPIMLVPKFSVRRKLSLNSQEFYNFHMIEFLRTEYLNAGGALVKTFKNGTPYVRKKAVKEKHPFSKNDLADFVYQNPKILDTYKKLKGASGPIANDDIFENFDERLFARSLIERFAQIPPGNDAASEYHSHAFAVCTFLFYPNLICPVKEYELYDGRKRVDIKYTNSATEGFFNKVLQAPQTRSLVVMIECKNYTKEIANPELDQLAGRFGHQRGFFGMLLCRSIDDEVKLTLKCKDTASSGRGFMLVLDDTQLIKMLRNVEEGKRDLVELLLHKKFDQLTN